MESPFASRDAHLSDLPTILGLVEAACEQAGLDADAVAELQLAAEEVYVNVIRHGYAGRAPAPVEVTCHAAPGEVRVTITDAAPLFDPASLPPPDLDAAWADRPIGGLGWHLVRQVMDEVRHEAIATGGNRVTLVKRSPASP